MRGENWEETRNWENRDFWRFLCNSGPISLEMTYELKMMMMEEVKDPS